ncbi:LysE family transporter [Lutispora sp.]|uniref:LysE family transporter n=1 Tax=Lutispora sp. TaxID=2828727 RepID=UPI002B1F7986|nr:LysE family transporter [Lutispora sp.]MEA4961030.1 LysE family transporter [Lutispora sp.]
MPDIAAFLSYVLVTTFTPGPNTIMSMSNASRYGFKKSIRFITGIICGFFIIFVLSSIFSIALYRLIPSVKSAMTVIGAAYIMWLAWKTYKSKPHSIDENTKSTNTFMAGLLLQFVNIKLILYAITTVSTFIVPYYKSPLVLISFCALLTFIGFLANCSWALFGAVFQKFLAKNDRVVNAVMALLLVYCAIKLFF